MSCKRVITPVGQSFPPSNARTILVDKALPDWVRSEAGEVFSYKLTTLKKSGKALVQQGNAPNYKGGRITLCTCMHHHRTWPRIRPGTWIAGFSDNASDNKLFYLMRVEDTVDSFDAMWRSRFISSLAAKSASRDIFGDVYEPVSAATAAHPCDPRFYRRPVFGHKHVPGGAWRRDIGFKHWSTGAPHKLLIGERGKSFLWEHPRYGYKPPPHPRFRFHDSVAAFIETLE